ncbi:hypothetical protein [Niabella aurantiaca]|uniref:hypothetical protein n=1 Tax=Niabella aurantiaca TaxID=379900 RepID=UPI0003828DFB|nr:hypothetical protein [Niabella aurantiaca]
MQQQHLSQRTKKYFNCQANCAHAWAHQLYDEGHASNFYFEGPVIYSYGYHFPIAVLDGHNVFFTLQSRSLTTTLHKNITLSAVSHKNIVYVEELPQTGDVTSELFKKENLDCWIAQIEMALNEYEKYPRRRSLLSQTETALSRLTRFAEVMGVTLDPTLQQLLNSPSIEALRQFKQEEKRKQQREERKRIANARRKYNKEITEWKAGRIETFDHSAPGIDANLAYLRLNTDQTIIQTSKGIRLSIEKGYDTWRFIKAALAKNAMNFNYHIDGFKVTSVTPDFFTVGCHKIPMNEVNEIAKRLDW